MASLEQRARELADGLETKCSCEYEAILAALRATREEALERAAEIADEAEVTLEHPNHMAAQDIAAAIRAEKER